MQRHPELSVEYIQHRLVIDVENGRAFWRDATKYHANLVGKEAGHKRRGHQGKLYWVIKLDGIP